MLPRHGLIERAVEIRGAGKRYARGRYRTKQSPILREECESQQVNNQRESE